MELKKDKPQTVSGFTRRFDSKTFFYQRVFVTEKTTKKFSFEDFCLFLPFHPLSILFWTKKKELFVFSQKDFCLFSSFCVVSIFKIRFINRPYKKASPKQWLIRKNVSSKSFSFFFLRLFVKKNCLTFESSLFCVIVSERMKLKFGT